MAQPVALEATPSHLAAAQRHAEIVRLLLAACADPSIRDSKNDGDAISWAHHFQQAAIVEILKSEAS